MDASQLAINDLQKRMEYQESIHKDISATPTGFVYGVISGWPIFVASILVAGFVSYIICKSKFKSA